MSFKSSKSIELDSRDHLKGLSVSIYLFADTLNVEGGTLTQPFNIQDVPFAHLTAILEFMYAGEVRNLPLSFLAMLTFIDQVNVAQEQLPAFLKTAEKLKIKGLAEGTQGPDE